MEAAERVVAREGAAHLTLDAVAREAGLSKGGLLYNFPNKDALLRAMVDSMTDRIDRRREEVRSEVVAGPNKALREILAVEKNELIDRRAGLAILAASAENPSLLDPIKARLSEVREEIAATSSDPLDAYIVWLARDMLMMWDVLGVSPFEESEVEAILARLARRAAGHAWTWD
ncbi:TetR/AcrR family transcriptional regulator [Lutibaculum baratangense]|uniref:Transcriptional regulator, TetR family n=1 Tax=Lutibaculum baratangense AMV1 TaxID=631454 RepID=V4R2R5_9HYPH|nr:TetR/AcrR family transcriptional regulator [Lutibaculum baratangense]ESR26247.1 Transcriptional regulator, TetR family [Lutibaculum baratangense AMV1]